MNNALIYGKDETSRVVSVEIENSSVTVFTEQEDGKIETRTVPYSPYILFAEQYNSKMKRLSGNQAFRWIYEAESVEKYVDVLSACYKKRYDLHNIRDQKEAFLVKTGVTYFKDMKVSDVSVLSFDLEHSYGIGKEPNPKGEILLISNTFRKNGKVSRRLFSRDEYNREGDMIEAWCEFVKQMNPSVVVGHNLFGHDLQILKFASEREEVKLSLGRDESPVKFHYRNSMFRKDGSQAYDYINAWIYGREIVDTYFLAMKFDVARNYESYGLKTIIKHEGLEREGRTHYDASLIPKDWHDLEKRKQIKAYAIDDADDALKLFDLMIPSLFYYTQSIPRSFQQIINTATGSQINSLMVRSYLQQGFSIARGAEAVEYEGAISFGVPGIHKNVLRFDVASLYPSIMRQYKIYCKDKDPEGLFLRIVEYFTIERLNNKRLGKETGDRYYKDLEQAQKIVINSCYGFLGAPKSNYNYPEGAALVTKHGRRILQQAIKKLSGKEYNESA